MVACTINKSYLSPKTLLRGTPPSTQPLPLPTASLVVSPSHPWRQTHRYCLQFRGPDGAESLHTAFPSPQKGFLTLHQPATPSSSFQSWFLHHFLMEDPLNDSLELFVFPSPIIHQGPLAPLSLDFIACPRSWHPHCEPFGSWQRLSCVLFVIFCGLHSTYQDKSSRNTCGLKN